MSQSTLGGSRVSEIGYPEPQVSESVQPYRWLAQYYDQFFEPLRMPVDAARERVLQGILPRVETACDLACGTGLTAVSLAQRGIRVYAVDLSPVMCRLARRKARAERVKVRVIESDMCTFELPERVDLVTCECDALNHVPRRSDLGRVARAVRRALKPGGHFFFEINNAEGFRTYWSGTNWLEESGVVAVMRNGHNVTADKAWTDIEWFVQRGKFWRRHHERVEEVAWTTDAVVSALGKAGFDPVHSWDAAPFYAGSNPWVGPGCRSIYLARKAR